MIPSMYSNAVLADAPALYYRMGELTGTKAFDSSGNGRDATINGGVAPGASGLIQKDRDAAMLFDGASGYLGSGYTTGTLSSLSVECWLKLSNSSLAGYPAITSNDFPTSSNKGFELFAAPASDGASGYFAVGFGASHTTLAFGSGALAPFATYHLVAVYDGAHMFVYVNGQQAATTSASGTIAVPTYDIEVGRYASDGGYLPAIIDEFAFYQTGLSPARVSAHYATGLNSLITSPQDTFLNKFQMAKVYDSSGNFLGVLKDAPLLSGFKEQINAAADPLRFTLPRAIDAFDGQYQPQSANTLIQGNVIQWWLYGAGLPTAGLLKYQGIIDAITPTLGDNGGESVEVVVTPYSQILGDHGVTSAFSIGTAGSSTTYVDSGTIFRSFFSGQYQDANNLTQSTIDANTSKPYGNPYTLDPTGTTLTGQKVQAAFQNQTLLSALSTVLLLSPANSFFRMNQDKTVYFGLYPTTPTYTLLLGQHISMLQYSLDNVPRKNVIVIQGKGTVKATAVGASVATLGERIYFKNDNRITDTATAQLLANGILALYDRSQIRATVKIPDYRGDAMPGLGYDIERFHVGQTVKIVDTKAPPSSIQGVGGVWGQMIWGSGKWGPPSNTPAIWGAFNWGSAVWGTSFGNVFNAVIPIMAITYDYFSVTLELGWRQPTLNRKLYLLESAFSDSSMVS